MDFSKSYNSSKQSNISKILTNHNKCSSKSQFEQTSSARVQLDSNNQPAAKILFQGFIRILIFILNIL